MPNLALGFCPLGFCSSGILIQWAFVRSPSISCTYIIMGNIGLKVFMSALQHNFNQVNDPNKLFSLRLDPFT